MIIECPTCHARFNVAAAQFPVTGRSVRCGRCSHEWFAPPAPSSAATSTQVNEPEAQATAAKMQLKNRSEEAIGEDVLQRLDAMIADPQIRATPSSITSPRSSYNPKPFMIATPILAALWLVMSLTTYFPRWSAMPVLADIYHMVGIVPLDGLVFADVGMQREQKGNRAKFLLTGSIRNYSSETREVPIVRVILKDSNNKTIWGRSYPVNSKLDAGDVYPFRISNVETSFASNVSSIVVDMGNPLQLAVR